MADAQAIFPMNIGDACQPGGQALRRWSRPKRAGQRYIYCSGHELVKELVALNPPLGLEEAGAAAIRIYGPVMQFLATSEEIGRAQAPRKVHSVVHKEAPAGPEPECGGSHEQFS